MDLKRDHFAQIVDFDLVVLKVQMMSSLLHFVVLQCLLLFPRYACSKYKNTLGVYLRTCVFLPEVTLYT